MTAAAETTKARERVGGEKGPKKVFRFTMHQARRRSLWAPVATTVALALCVTNVRPGMAFAARVLVTGGAGYIGSHTCVELIKAGEKVGFLCIMCVRFAVERSKLQTIVVSSMHSCSRSRQEQQLMYVLYAVSSDVAQLVHDTHHQVAGRRDPLSNTAW